MLNRSKILEEIDCCERKFKLATSRGNFEAFLLKKPGENLSMKVKTAIFNEFYPVALSAFGKTESPQFNLDVSNHLFNVGFLILVFDFENEGAGVAFRTFTFLDYKQLKILYIEGTAIKAEYQGRGIYQNLTKELATGMDFVVSRTQNPVVITALSKLFREVYPVTAKPNETIKNIGFYVSEHLNMSEYERDFMIGRKTYGGILTGTLPDTGNGMKKAVFKLINPEDGDCLIVVCPV